MLQEAYFVMRRKLAALSIELYKPDYVINIPHNIAGLWDYDKATQLIEHGKMLTNKVVPDSAYRKKVLLEAK